MVNISADQIRSLVPDVVAELYQRRHSAVPGAVLKLELVRRTTEQGSTFDERALGFRNFYDLVSHCDVTVERRLGSDFVVLPSSVRTVPPSEPGVRIQRDIWYAFVSFPVPGIRRSFDPVTVKVVYEDESVLLGGKAVIEPISVEQQVAWRKEFAAALSGPESQELVKAFTAQHPFRDFSIRVRRQPALAKAWNAFLLNKVLPIIEQWADQNKIPRERWLQLSESKPEHDLLRRELYAFFDAIPLSDLLNLQVPVRWVVDRSKRTD